MNKVILIGNLARDPEMHTTQGGVPKCSFTVAVQRRFANQQGVREADFIPVVAWRSTAEFCGRFFQKGKKIAVVGSLQVRSYDAQDGTKRYVTEVVADEVEFVTPANSDGVQRSGYADAPAAQPAAPSGGAYQPTQMEQADDDELPF